MQYIRQGFIAFAKERIDFTIVENGSNISSGQKQKIAIDRALIRKHSLLGFT